MRQPPTIQMLPDGRRVHLHDGPIDLIVEAFGDPAEIREAYRAAANRFGSILDELCVELPLLRSRASRGNSGPDGPVARRMYAAVLPFASRVFITPMAAVAGAVAEEILEAMTHAANLSRAYVNDGGDIAIHLSRSEHFSVGMVNNPEASRRPESPCLFGSANINFEDSTRGIATSGWRGRSFSLGIADAVTVLAPRAAMADAAATVIANAVNLPGHPGIIRIPARDLAPDNDLGQIPVTRVVPPLRPAEIADALARGVQVARELLGEGLVCAAALHLQGATRVVDRPSRLAIAPRAESPANHRGLAHA